MKLHRTLTGQHWMNVQLTLETKKRFGFCKQEDIFKQCEDDYAAFNMMNKTLENEHKTFGSLIIGKRSQIMSKYFLHPKPNRKNKRITS